MRQFKQNPIRFDVSELETDLGKDNFIFVGSSCDMFAEDINFSWVIETLRYCSQFDNKYLFQTKNPRAFVDWNLKEYLPQRIVLGTTIETNRYYEQMGSAPSTLDRSDAMRKLSEKYETMVTVEPIMDFDLGEMLRLVGGCNPKWINVGGDSKGHKLPEPSPEKVKELIAELSKITEIRQKRNLKRLLKDG